MFLCTNKGLYLSAHIKAMKKKYECCTNNNIGSTINQTNILITHTRYIHAKSLI